jgi:hypothetical protein
MTPAVRALLQGDLREAQRLATTPDDHLAILAATKSTRLAHALDLMQALELTASPAVMAFVAAHAKDHTRAKTLLTADAFHGDHAQLACEAVLILGEPTLVADALAVAEHLPARDDLRPVPTLRGELCLVAGRIDEAVRYVEEGLTLARTRNAVPHIADAATVLARALDARGEPGDRDRAVMLSAEAHELWHRCSVVL